MVTWAPSNGANQSFFFFVCYFIQNTITRDERMGQLSIGRHKINSVEANVRLVKKWGQGYYRNGGEKALIQ